MIDLEALERLSVVVRAVVRHRIRDSHQAEDLCQETLLNCWHSSHVKGQVPSEAYVVQSAVNACRSWARKLRVRGRSEALDPETKDRKEKGPVTELEESEWHRVILAALAMLPPHYREIARLNLLEERSVRQIAEATCLPLNTVKTRLRRAKDILKRRLKLQIED